MINWPLISNPANWIIVAVFVAIWITVLTFTHQVLTGSK